MCNYAPADYTCNERYEYYKAIPVQSLKIYYQDSTVFPRQYNFTYYRGYGKYKYQDEFVTHAGGKAADDFYDKCDKIYDVVYNNPKITSKQLAKATAAKIERPDISKKDYMSTVNVMGSYFKSSKELLSDMYDMQVKYIVDDTMYFTVIGSPIKYIVFTSSDGLYSFKCIDESGKYSVYTSDYFRKKCTSDGYFDMKGNYYQTAERVPYYNSDGKTFYFYTAINKTGDTSIGDVKTYYITDRKHIYYDIENCYINENGYLYYDSSNSLKKYDDTHYKSTSGKLYTKLSNTSWDKDGTILVAEES